MKRVLLGIGGACALTVSAASVDKPDSVYLFTNDLVVVEAEGLTHNGKWQFLTTPAGFTGAGYLKYVGPWTYCQENEGVHPYAVDITGKCQGQPEDRLYIPTVVTTPGVYSVNIHCYHVQSRNHVDLATSDYGIWVHILNWKPPIHFEHADTPSHWAWLRFGPEFTDSPWGPAPAKAQSCVTGCVSSTFNITAKDTGLVIFYLAGMNPFFCVDRIHIYRRLAVNVFPANYMDAQTPVSTKVPIGSVATGIRHGRSALDRPRPAQGLACNMRGQRIGPGNQGVSLLSQTREWRLGRATVSHYGAGRTSRD